MQVVSRTDIAYRIVLGALAGAGIGLIVGAVSSFGWMVGVGAFAAVTALGLRPTLRRMRTVKRPIEEGVQHWLEAVFPFYRLVDRDAFDRDVKIVLDEWVFEAVGSIDVTDDARAGVAAGAALLLHGRPEWDLPRRQTVLLYADRFDGDYLVGDAGAFDGMAHQQGPIILSLTAVEESWADGRDGSNVVLHELAHLLDYENEFADGVPSLVDPSSAVAWRELVQSEIRRVRIGRSMLRRYAATNPAELFAVAVENFFERPEKMAGKHPELFDALKSLFRIDPHILHDDGQDGMAQ